MRIEKEPRSVYIAEDGKRFESKTECEDYERALERKNNFKALKGKVDAIECIENSYPPFGYSYVDDERYEYRWYKPKNQEEVDALNRFFNVDVGNGDEAVGRWVGVEIDGDYDSYTGREDVYVISSLDDSVKKLTDFYAAFGYRVEVRRD